MLADKKLTSIRLSRSLYSQLQKEAKKQNRSVNNYIETLLLDSIEKVPNEETIEAINEVQEMIKNGTGKPIKNIREFLEQIRDEDDE